MKIRTGRRAPGEEMPTGEILRLRIALGRIEKVLQPADNSDNVSTVGVAREIALAALNR